MCRSTPTLHVAIMHKTPRSVWAQREAQSWLNATSDGGTTSRVPLVRALTLTWQLSTEGLLQRAARELWEGAETLRLGANSTGQMLESAVWPRGIKRLVLDTTLEVPVEAVLWPSAVEEISFGDRFNRSFDQPITCVAWPSSLRILCLGYYFNQAITAVMSPRSLDHLSLGRSFNQPIVGTVWPTSLKILRFGQDFNQSIAGVLWPPCL